MVDQVARRRRARRTDALGAAPVPVRQLKRPGIYAVGDGVGVAGRHVRVDRVVRRPGGRRTRSQTRGRAGIYPGVQEGTESGEV